MGFSIRAISKAKLIDCDGNAIPGDPGSEACEHDCTISEFPLGREKLKSGCYVPRKGGRKCSFEISYREYAVFFDELYRFVYGLDANELCQKYRRHRGRQFIEFVDGPSASQGEAIGPKMCAKLHSDFVEFAAQAKKHFNQHEDLVWMWDVYRGFKKLLKLASDDGFVCYW